MERRFGAELVADLKAELERERKISDDRFERISNGEMDEDDCFISQNITRSIIGEYINKINLIEKDNGCAWFPEYATLDGTLVKARWCGTKYGLALRVVMPDNSVVWVSSSKNFDKSLAKKGLKCVECLRPAWYCVKGGQILGHCHTEIFPSKFNYATGEEASDEPIAVRDIKD